MIVRIKRSGGFAGVEEDLGTINTSALTDEVAARVKNSVTKLNRLKDAREHEPVGADMFRYEIEIHNDQGEHQQLVFTDDGDPDNPFLAALRELLDALEASS